MEEIEGIPSKLPLIAPFPAPKFRQTLHSEEWKVCVDAWIFCVEFRLRLPPAHFHHCVLSSSSSAVTFLSSYLESWNFNRLFSWSYRPQTSQEHKLHRYCLLLTRRLLLESASSYDCSARDLFTMLANASTAFDSSHLWIDTLQQAWYRQEKLISEGVDERKSDLIRMMAKMEANSHGSVRQLIYQTTSLSRCLPQAGKIMMTGRDYIESLTSSYRDLPSDLDSADVEEMKRLLTKSLFVCQKSLMTGINSSASLLLDNLYGLKANAEAEAKINPNRPTLLSSLVCSTLFLKHLDEFLTASPTGRANSVLHFLLSYKNKMAYLHLASISRSPRGRKRKEKQKAKVDQAAGEMYVHEATQVSQIHELFPTLPTPYILQLLDHFGNDIENATSALLEPESLPVDLRNPKIFADASIDSELPSQQDNAPNRTRRNVFDDDEFDNLQVSASQVHIGRKERTVGDASSPSDKARRKAAIMAALTAFDLDDDERDDTYDVADIGGTIDNTIDIDEGLGPRGSKDNEKIDRNEQVLFQAWKGDPRIFARDSKTRLSQPRQELKNETGMGDEQIEGWALMLSRDESAVRKLENRYGGTGSFGGHQEALGTTKWSAGRSGTATEEETDPDPDGKDLLVNRRGSSIDWSFRGGRSHGNGSGRASSLLHEPGTSQESKEHGRGRGSGRGRGRGRGGVNHNRREGRARKMGRGFGNVPPS